MDQRTIRRLAVVFTLLTVLAAMVMTASVGLALIPQDSTVVPLVVSAVVTALLAGATILLFRRLDD